MVVRVQTVRLRGRGARSSEITAGGLSAKCGAPVNDITSPDRACHTHGHMSASHYPNFRLPFWENLDRCYSSGARIELPYSLAHSFLTLWAAAQRTNKVPQNLSLLRRSRMTDPLRRSWASGKQTQTSMLRKASANGQPKRLAKPMDVSRTRCKERRRTRHWRRGRSSAVKSSQRGGLMRMRMRAKLRAAAVKGGKALKTTRKSGHRQSSFRIMHAVLPEAHIRRFQITFP